jgi:hypothetical protein
MKKHVVRTLLLIAAMQWQPGTSIGQNTNNCLIGFDYIKGFINEPSVSMWRYMAPNRFMTFSLGYTYDHKSIREKL